ncbi:crotonase/enoyl-CoA hydratase family protein [Rhizorhabdus argentea]|uniref:crotonase/enoyl-CoA hydratase family protein n=1 Tax=Rhizorhabdus argentea TaxID=1387174 RepID=UPI0030EE9FCE
MPFEFILYDVQGGYATVTLNRPEKRNALSMELLTELSAALWEADDDTAVHAVLLKGAGKDFSAGYDLTPNLGISIRPKLRDTQYRRGSLYEEGFASVADDSWRLEYSQRLRMTIFDMHKPVVAQIHGNCLAGGTDLALLCDMIIAADDANIGVPPVRDVGTTPNSMWLYHMGPQWAKRLMLTGDTLSGEDAAKAGLVLKSVPADILDAEAASLMRRLGKVDIDLLHTNKRIINLGLELMGARTLQRLAAENDAALHTAEVTRRFRDLAREKGLKAAFDNRNTMFPDGQARFDRPELRDADGRFVKDD